MVLGIEYVGIYIRLSANKSTSTLSNNTITDRSENEVVEKASEFTIVTLSSEAQQALDKSRISDQTSK